MENWLIDCFQDPKDEPTSQLHLAGKIVVSICYFFLLLYVLQEIIKISVNTVESIILQSLAFGSAHRSAELEPNITSATEYALEYSSISIIFFFFFIYS